jgi:hypothetical protein
LENIKAFKYSLRHFIKNFRIWNEVCESWKLFENEETMHKGIGKNLKTLKHDPRKVEKSAK